MIIYKLVHGVMFRYNSARLSTKIMLTQPLIVFQSVSVEFYMYVQSPIHGEGIENLKLDSRSDKNRKKIEVEEIPNFFFKT